MDGLTIDDLVIRVDRSVSACVRLDWLGASTSAHPGQAIAPFFEDVLREARESARSVEMHFEELEHFNSATIATLLRLINSAGKAKVPLRIYFDGRLRWQALSFGPLERAVQSFASGERLNVEFLSTHS
jgi:hypothetical protein